VEDKDEAVVSQAMGEVRVLFSSVMVWELEYRAPKTNVAINCGFFIIKAGSTNG
jgi:hypothetical protein